jgi:leucyl-tRNA synthetase
MLGPVLHHHWDPTDRTGSHVAHSLCLDHDSYVNARPHLGHVLEYVEADAYARHMAAQGQDVYLLSGSDENSLKNLLAAERHGISTRELVDQNVTSSASRGTGSRCCGCWSRVSSR